MSDSKILNILLRGYGRQAGWANVRLFSKVWTAATLKGRSVPRLILEEVRALNGLDDAGLKQMGKDAYVTKDTIKAHNFIRLTSVRYPDLNSRPAGINAVLRKLAQYSDGDIAEQALQILAPASKVEAASAQEETPVEAEEPETDQTVVDILDANIPLRRRVGMLEGILRTALRQDGPRSEGNQEHALGQLETLFEKWGFDTVYDRVTLASLNADKKAMADLQRQPFKAVKNRPMMKDHIFFSRKIDLLLATRMFDGHPNGHRLALVNFIRAHTYPEELPILHSQVLEIITSNRLNKGNQYDQSLARWFLAPSKEAYSAHLAWGQGLVEKIQDSPKPPPSALEFAAEYYRLQLGHALPGGPWGQNAGRHLNAAMRDETLTNIRKMDPEHRQEYRKAIIHLWSMLEHDSPQVRIAARYAIVGYPGYLLGLEDKIAAALSSQNLSLRYEAVALASMTEKGFSPKVDQMIESRFSPSEAEAELLRLRQKPLELDIWGPQSKS